MLTSFSEKFPNFSKFFDPQAAPKPKRAASTCSTCNKVGHNKKRCPEDPDVIAKGLLLASAKIAKNIVPARAVPNIPGFEDEVASDEDDNVPDEVNEQCLIDERAAEEEENDTEEILPALNIENRANKPNTLEKILIVERTKKELRSGELLEEDPFPPFKPLQNIGPLLCEDCKEPWSFMKLFITNAIIAQIVSSSNSYRLSMKYTSYSAVSESEIWTFIAVIQFMGINVLPERNYLWGNGEFASAYLKRHMSNRRFEQIMRIFHVVASISY